MRRAFDIDVLACPRCGGRMRLIATVEDPRVIRQILAHLGLPTEVPRPPPARAADPLLRHPRLTAPLPACGSLRRALPPGRRGPAVRAVRGADPLLAAGCPPGVSVPLDRRFIRAVASGQSPEGPEDLTPGGAGRRRLPPAAPAVAPAVLGQRLVTTLVLPFEVISLVFVATLVGAIVVARGAE
jgi:hypothetical protein